jgi:hypothetical protein
LENLSQEIGMTSSDWLTLFQWVAGLLGTVLMILLGIVAYFIKRMIDTNDSTRKAMHNMRNDMHSLRVSFRLFKMEIRLLMKQAGIDVSSMSQLGEDDIKPLDLEGTG